MRARLPLPRRGRAGSATLLYIVASLGAVAFGARTPKFARETKMPCSSCHVHIPRLNKFGQQFYANGFKLPKNHQMYKTVPLWVGAEAQATAGPDQGAAIDVSYDSTVIGSGGYLDKVDILYNAIYSPVPNELDDLYGIHPFSRNVSLFAGKTVVMSQFDPGLDISGTTLGAYLGPDGTNPSAPATAMGPFSPGGTATFLRTVLNTGASALPYADGWHLAATVPFSNELGGGSGGGGPTVQLSTKPKGIFTEGYLRQGMDSYGVNAFAGEDGRHFYGAVAQKSLGPLYLQGGAAYAEGGFGGKTHVYSASVDWVPKFDTAFAFRVDSQNGALAFVPLVSCIVGGHESAWQFQVESMLSRGVAPSTTLSAVFRF